MSRDVEVVKDKDRLEVPKRGRIAVRSLVIGARFN